VPDLPGLHLASEQDPGLSPLLQVDSPGCPTPPMARVLPWGAGASLACLGSCP